MLQQSTVKLIAPDGPNDPSWYISAQLILTLLFNPLQRLVRNGCCRCCACAGPCAADPGAPRTLGAFASALLLWGLIAHVGTLGHFWWFTRAASFALGIFLGHSCLSVELDDAQEARLARATDALALLLPLVCATSQAGVVLAFVVYPWVVGLVIFGLCRARASRAASLLSCELFAGFAPYTYAAYLIHVPVMHWHVFAVANGLDSIADALTIDFARAECEPVSEGFFERGAERENDDLPASELRCYGGSYSYVAGFTTSIVAAVLLVVLVDRPAKALIQRLVNGAP